MLLIDGQQIPGEFIGKGLFAKAYRYGDMVYLLVKGDSSKEALATFADTSLRHMPRIVRHENWKDYQVFSMPYYHKLSKTAWPEAYKDWQRLNQLVVGRQSIQAMIENDTDLTDSLRAALQTIIDAFGNYTDSGMVFEPRKVNVSVDSNGVLILRDVVACSFEIAEKRTSQRQRYQYHGRY